MTISSSLPPLHLSLKGETLLKNPLLNKGLAFSKEERENFELNALLPSAILTLEEQVAHSYRDIMRYPETLMRHIALRHLQDTNETLFYALLDRHITEIMPLIYTPGVGEACLNFSKIWHYPRGIFLTPHLSSKEDILSLINPSHYDNIRLIIITDGERILGLGDLGANGMGIPIGKLSLYTACAGLNPALMLPITLDVGTNNEALLNDPSYIGLKQKRLKGAAYDAFLENVISAIKARWPQALLHWEDFAGHHAATLLERYRDKILSFNDDIQGTAAITTASLLAAIKSKNETLSQQRIAIFGGGSAGCGIAAQLLQVFLNEGIEEEEARQAFYIFDKAGLLTDDMEALSKGQRAFARRDWKENTPQRDLAHMVKIIRPTILIGVSGQAGAFTQEIITHMAQYCQEPLIFPLSNPTSHIEATPCDILKWTNGKAIVSTGSPFEPVLYEGRKISIDQTNNSYIFPGLGLGALACHASKISDKMLMKAAEIVASHAPRLQGGQNLLPPLSMMKELAIAVARAVAFQAREENLCPHFDDAHLSKNLKALLWSAEYRPYRPII